MIKVAAIQLWHDDHASREDRTSHVEQLIDSAAGSDLILLPELWNIGWWSFGEYYNNSETLHGATISRMAEKAKEVNAYIFAGSIVEKSGDSLYNTSVLLNPRGKTIATYRKMHLMSWGGAREAELMRRGEKIVTVKTEMGTLGFSICYDLRFPELFRQMAVNHGVDIFLNVSAWPITRLDNWRELCHVRAAENLCFMIACNAAGINHGKQFSGHSAIINPLGTPVVSAGIYESVVKGEIDTAEVRKAREFLPALNDRFLPI